MFTLYPTTFHLKIFCVDVYTAINVEFISRQNAQHCFVYVLYYTPIDWTSRKIFPIRTCAMCQVIRWCEIVIGHVNKNGINGGREGKRESSEFHCRGAKNAINWKSIPGDFIKTLLSCVNFVLTFNWTRRLPTAFPIVFVLLCSIHWHIGVLPEHTHTHTHILS